VSHTLQRACVSFFVSFRLVFVKLGAKRGLAMLSKAMEQLPRFLSG